MTRSRMKLSFIEDEAKRKACYKKRKMGLIKKVKELTTICGVEACIIIYSNFDDEPQIWPPEHSAVKEILQKFKSLSLPEQNRKMVTQESFITLRIKKLLELCKKLRDDNQQHELRLFVSESFSGVPIENFNLPDLKKMRRPIHLVIDNVSRQIDAIKEKESSFPTLSLMLPNRETGNNQPVVVEQEEVADVGYRQNPTTRGIMNMMINHPPGNTANSYYPSAVIAPETNNLQNSVMVQNEQRFGASYGYAPIMAQQSPQRFGASYGYAPMLTQQSPTWSTNMNTVAQNQQPTTGLLFPNAYIMNDPGRNSSSSGMNPVVQPVPSRRHEQSPSASNTTDWISFLLRDYQGSAGNSGFFSPP